LRDIHIPDLSVITKSRILVSRLALVHQHRIWTTHLPQIQPYYAVKSNPDPTLLEWIRAQRTIRVDCASPAEMDLCVRAGFEVDDILYANTMKSGEDLQAAADRGIRMTTTDSVEGVEQIATTSWRPRVIVRIAVDDSGSRSPFSLKFGATEDEWLPVMRAIRKYNLPFGGVSFHVGSASSNPEAFGRAIQRCRTFQKAVNCDIPLVDIGGGFQPNETLFQQTARQIQKGMRDWEMDSGSPPRQLIAEPGRFFSAPTQTVLVPIVFKKASKDRVRYMLDDSVYGQFSGIVYDHAKPFWNVIRQGNYGAVKGQEPGAQTNRKAFFFGKTCDSLDLIAIQDHAPDYEIGDVFAFPWMGAYTSASATEFNGFQLPAKTYINDTTAPFHPLFNEIERGDPNITFPIETQSKISLSVMSDKIYS
jgi:ornithine decarboxylase